MDLTSGEFIGTYTGYRNISGRLDDNIPFDIKAPAADRVDWREKGALNPIKN